MNSSYAKLVENLEYLKLNQMITHLDETIDFMNNNQLSFVDTLIKLTDYEIDMKEINMVRSMVKVAGFPHRKEVKDFDFTFQPSVNKEKILDFTFLSGNPEEVISSLRNMDITRRSSDLLQLRKRGQVLIL